MRSSWNEHRESVGYLSWFSAGRSETTTRGSSLQRKQTRSPIHVIYLLKSRTLRSLLIWHFLEFLHWLRHAMLMKLRRAHGCCESDVRPTLPSTHHKCASQACLHVKGAPSIFLLALSFRCVYHAGLIGTRARKHWLGCHERYISHNTLHFGYIYFTWMNNYVIIFVKLLY